MGIASAGEVMHLPIAERVLLELGGDALASPSASVRMDEDLADRVANGLSASILRLWECGRSVVVPRRRLRDQAFDVLVDSEGEAWPLCTRSSGGGAVALGPGTLNVSLILRRRAALVPSIRAAYAAWTTLLGRALLDRYGIAIETGAVDGAFCPGSYDLGVAGRKLAGVAQIRRTGSIVVHGTVLVDIDPISYLRLVADADRIDAYDANRIVSVSQLTSSAVDCEGLAIAIAATAQCADWPESGIAQPS